MFSTQQKYGVSKAVAEKKMVSVSVDGASVNMGRHKGLKVLIQNNPGMSGVIQIWMTGDGGGFCLSTVLIIY